MTSQLPRTGRPISAPGLVSLGFIKAAVRRSARFLFVMAVVGLLVGFGVYVRVSPLHTRPRRRCCLRISPYENTLTAAVNNQAMAETRAVAGLAVQELGLQQSASSFLSTYTATSVTDRLLTVTASAPSSNQAVLRASAVASAFLKFRADELQGQQNLVLESLNQQINQAKQRIDSIDAQISQLQASPLHPRSSRSSANYGRNKPMRQPRWPALQQTVIGNQTTTQPELTAALKSSQVLSVAAASSLAAEAPDHVRSPRTHSGTCRGLGHHHRPRARVRSTTPTGRHRVCARRSCQAQCRHVARSPPTTDLAWPGGQEGP